MCSCNGEVYQSLLKIFCYKFKFGQNLRESVCDLAATNVSS